MDTKDIIDMVIANLEQAKSADMATTMFDDKNVFIININVFEKGRAKPKSKPRKPKSYHTDFQKLLNVWPNKDAPDYGYAEWQVLVFNLKEITSEELIAVAKSQVEADYSKREAKFVPLLGNWIKRGTWKVGEKEVEVTPQDKERVSYDEIRDYYNSQRQYILENYTGHSSHVYQEFLLTTHELIPFDDWLNEYRAE